MTRRAIGVVAGAALCTALIGAMAPAQANVMGGSRDCPGTTNLTVHAYFIGWGLISINEGFDGTGSWKNNSYQWRTVKSSRSRLADWTVEPMVTNDPGFWVDKAYTTCD